MQAWEALYPQMLNIFVTTDSSDACNLLEDIAILAHSLKASDILPQCHEQLGKLKKQFDSFALCMADQDPNWKFWAEFIQLNCFAYIALFCAVWSGNWNLRLGALKLMAPLYCAFDRPTYQRLLPQHLVDSILLPTNIATSLFNGGFSVSIKGRPWHSV